VLGRDPALGLTAIIAVTVATIVIGVYGLRFSRTTSDFYVASRSVSPWWNASAIGGEYLSAASFLGVAGLVLAFGVDMLWFPVGYTAGYLVLLVLVAAPLRRSGAYTLPDFAEARLESLLVRRISSVLVVLIGWVYLLPQFLGAGLTLHTVTGAPSWLGGLVVALVVVANVASGGMRSITFVQAFQYWLKVTAIAVPAFFILVAWRADGQPALTADERPRFREEMTVRVEEPVALKLAEPVTLEIDGVPTTLPPGKHDVAEGAELVFPPGAEVPSTDRTEVVSNKTWAEPLGFQEHPLYTTYSLVLATFLGTMGLPHVLVRFYTNPDGRAARRTTLVVLSLLGLFYLFPAVYGALGRVYAPDLLFTGRADAVVLVLPGRLAPGLAGDLLFALVTAGAFAAFLSTSSGLTVSVAGVLSQDVLPGGVRSFRIATVLAVAVPLALAPAATGLAVASVVGLAFAVAASSFCPLLVLGIWWRRLTAHGAAAGLLVGGGLAITAVIVTVVAGRRDGWAGALLALPAAWTVPVAFLVMIVVSLATPRAIAASVARTMVRLHTPESVDVDRGDWRPKG
jgi:Na+(H+)/acetate symporter ActP